LDTPSNELEGIAIVGMSGRFPGAKSVDQFWQNLIAGVDCISKFSEGELEYSVLTPEARSRGKRSVAARGVLEDVDLFDAAFFGIYPKEAELMDPQHRIFLECAWESLESAGYNPQTYPGMIGVFAGVSLNTYLLHNLCGDGKFAGKLAGNYQVGEYQAMLGNDKDFMPTRISYKLNLRGPSMAIQTACSSSLVAVSQACSSLMSYQCDMALAGGVSITFPQKRDYLYEEEGMVSVDGTCRTFDADAKGTVFGHGSAVVLLKRLNDAVNDGDHILAVIKGTAVNNDGSDKIGYAAPSVNAQAEVIALAQAAADISPESISYIEAHGTGTPLGDPIEIAALTQAFRDGGATAKGFCAIGSGKPYISHLDVASGATGLIKTVMQLQHGQIPPLLHFRSPNPKIDFANSPFYPVKELTSWKRGHQPRRAGVSAFGVGGTNAHVIVEEAPQRASHTPSHRPQLFPLSAKTESALTTMRENLAAKLDAAQDIDLADVAYTLQLGRKPFEHRCTVVADNRQELIAALRADLKASVHGKVTNKQARVVFMFPGQGAQYVNMGRDLYENEAVFRSEVDRCADILQQHLDQDIRKVLYPANEAEQKLADQQINETWMTQPAIFVVEYALAKQWIAWGIRPAVLVGHSIGEYVCAVLAETFTLEESLALLSARAKLMQSLPGGSMLGVRLGASAVHPLLPSEASIAAINSSVLCTVSGPTQVLESFSAELATKNIASRMLATSHAFHSVMMDPMLSEFTSISEKTTRCDPKLLWISTCTGKPMASSDIADAAYWSRQLRQPVRFADALDTLLEATDEYVFLEVGPGRALNQFVRQHPAKLAGNRIVASLVPAENDSGDAGTTLAALGKLWVAGVQPNWEAIHADEQRFRVPLPTYPFERKRFWIETAGPATDCSTDSSVGAAKPIVASVTAPIVTESCECTSDGASSTATVQTVATVQAIASASPKEKIAQELRKIILNLSGMAVGDDDVSFIDLGFDSLFLSQASQAIDNRFGIKITFRQLLADLSTVSSIAGFLETRLPSEMFAEAESAPTPIVAAISPSAVVSTSPLALNTTLHATADIQRMLDSHVQNLQQLLTQSRRQSAQLGGSSSLPGNSLRVVRKSVADGKAADANGRPEETKRFGPYKPIEKGEKGGLTSRQENALNRLIERYVKRTAGSKAYTAEHRPHFADPRAVSGFRSQWKEMVYPIVSARSKGSKIWDIDGNEYVDITMGFGTYFFGHSPDWLISAVEKQLHTGIEIGPQSALAGSVAKMISEFTELERVTFCNTGSEAVMAAMRLARTVTGRNRIVYFTGDYHGMFEEVLVRGAWPNGEYRAQPIAPGIPQSMAENILVLEYGAAESLEIIKKHGDEIAAVMVEPVQSRNPSLQPREFLHQVRAITQEIGAALIFDEVVTGFRCHQGGAQAYFGVKADMATYGKVVGGGMPIGILAGTPKYMDALDGGMWQYGDDSFPEVGVTFFAGTFVRHPLAIAAAHAVLTFLKEAGPELQPKMTERVERVCRAVNQHMEQAQVPIRMSSFSAFAAIDYAHDLKFASLLWYYLRDKGIHIWEGRPCYFTLAHSDEDLQRFILAFRESVLEMQRDGFLPEAGGESESLPHSLDADRFALAEGQREMWLGAQMSPEAAGPHHACNAFVFDGELDLNAMRAAFSQVIQRHEGLRCTFNSDGTEVIVQAQVSFDLPLVDLSQLAAQDQEIRVQEIMDQEGKRLFDLSAGPLFQAQLLKLSDTKHQLIITAQMIVCDGWSHYVVFEELSEIYSALRERREPVLRAIVPMRAYARWQTKYWKTPEAKACEDYWLSQYKTVPSPLDLPSRGLRPLRRTVAAQRRSIMLSPEFYDKIKRFGRSQKSSSFAVLLAAFQLWLHRLSGSKDLVVGVPFSEQSSLGFDTLVGQCANTLPIRAQLNPNEPFAELLKRTWESLLDAQENTHYTFGRLIPHLDIRHDPSRIPLVSVIFNIDPAMTKVKFSGLKHHFFAGPRFYYQFDLGFNLVEEGAGLCVECDFNTNLFDGDIVQHWLAGYESLLGDVLTGDTKPLAMLCMLDHLESTVLKGPAQDLAGAATIHGRIEEQAKRTPESVAVRDEQSRISYLELNQRTDLLARKICRIGQQPLGRVGVVVSSDADMAVTQLAILKSGGTVVPVHSELTQSQISQILKDGDLSLILTNQLYQEIVREACCPVVSLEELSQADTNREYPPLNVDVKADDIAYVLYYPNPSGLLNGVELSHRSIVNMLASMQQTPGLSPSDVVLALSHYAYHQSLLELWLPLSVGAQSVIAADVVRQDASALRSLISTSGVTVIQASPTMLRKLLSGGWQGQGNLKILVGGEIVDEVLAERLQPCCDELWHVYGHRETSSWILTKRLRAASKVTLDSPIHNTSCFIVDDDFQPVPLGVPGELLIAGRSLAIGYRNSRELNAHRFIQGATTDHDHQTRFRTGERVRRLCNGELDWMGNRDSQVMVQGRDANLLDIEAALHQHASVDNVAVILRDEHASVPELVAYIFVSEHKLASLNRKALTSELRQAIRSKLPNHMLPARFVYLNDVPLTLDGCLDRARLPIPSTGADDLAEDFCAPANRTQETLVGIWQDLLKLSKMGINDNFFELGGQSLLAVKLFARIESEFGRKLPLATLLQAPTIAQLAAVLDDHGGSTLKGWSSLIPIQASGSRKPLFLVHGAGGNVLLYQAVSKHLAPDYPLYGLQSQGLDGESTPLQTIEQMATHYLRELRAIQPHGPYFLGGYCLGGTVAYEMAQQLLSVGEEVSLVAMLDTYNFSRALKSNMLGFLIQKLRFHLGNFLGLRPRHMIAYVKEKFRVARDGEFSNLFTSRPGFDVNAGRATSGAELQIQTINDLAAETYLPKPYPGKLTLFKPRINYKFYPDPKMGWGDLALGGLDIVEFPFNPHAMLVEPYVQKLADALIASMNQSPTGQGEHPATDWVDRGHIQDHFELVKQ
jgi:acyl transferase domain-containing protein/glutamate-1-semialdehyde aminotransferase/non-ribosomal peptide synthetase component F/thioesterase domain-containing protein